MNPSEIGHSLGRLEQGVSDIKLNVEKVLIPAIATHSTRLDYLEAMLNKVVGAAAVGCITISGMAYIGREVFISWLKKKMGLGA